MASITSTGLGSGLDIESLVKGLVSAEGQPTTQRLQVKEAKLQADLSALGTLKGALSAFQSSVQGMKDISTFQARTATSSSITSFTAAANSTAVTGSFAIRVDQLAAAAKVRTAGLAFASDAALVGPGVLNIGLGATNFNITTSAATTLAGLRDLINKASDNPGISASIVKVSDTDSQLVLTSTKTGAVNTISVTATPDVSSPAPPNDLTRIATANLTTVQTAANSLIQLDGQPVTRASNSLTDVISGVTIALVKADPLAIPGTLTVEVDKNAATSKVNDFVNAYNSLAGTLSNLSTYDAKTGTASRLFGDATLRGIQNQLRQVLSNSVVGGVAGASTLADIGIKTDKAGLLVLDSAKLDKAITANSDAVPQLFASTNGLSSSFDKVLTNYLAADGPLTARVDGVNKNIVGISTERDKLNIRLAGIEARYRKQFTAMDTLLGTLKNTGSFLTQQLTPQKTQ